MTTPEHFDVVEEKLGELLVALTSFSDAEKRGIEILLMLANMASLLRPEFKLSSKRTNESLRMRTTCSAN